MRTWCGHLIFVLMILLAAPGHGEKLLFRTPVGDGPMMTAIDPVKNTNYVSNYNSHNVTVQKWGDNASYLQSCGVSPYHVAVDPVNHRAFVSDVGRTGTDSLYVIDYYFGLDTALAAGQSPYSVASALDSFGTWTSNVPRVCFTGYLTDSLYYYRGLNYVGYRSTAGNAPRSLCINPLTMVTYAACESSNVVNILKPGGQYNVTVGSRPYAVVVNPATGRAYVSNYNDNTVMVIDEATATVIDTINVGANPGRMAVNPTTNRIYVSNYGGGTVSVINGATGSVATTRTVGSSPGTIAINTVTNRAYVACAGDTSLWVISGTGFTVSKLNLGRPVNHVAVNPVANRIYALHSAIDSISVIDGAVDSMVQYPVLGNNTWHAAFDLRNRELFTADFGSNQVSIYDLVHNCYCYVPCDSGTINVDVNPLTGMAYAANLYDSTVSVINGASYTVVARVKVGCYPRVVRVNPVTNYIYVANMSDNTVSVIDGSSNTVDTTIAVGAGPYSMAINPRTNMIYTGNYSGNSVTAIDGATFRTATIPAGSAPYDLAVHPGLNTVYVANNSVDSVTVIDCATNSVVARIHTGAGPRTLAVNPYANRLLVANAGGNNVTVINCLTNASSGELNVGTTPYNVQYDPMANQAYVTNFGSGSVSVIAFLNDVTKVTTIPTSTNPDPVVVDPVGGRAYVAHHNTVLATIDQQLEGHSQLVAELISPSSQSTGSAQPAVSGKAANRSAGNKVGIMKVMCSTRATGESWSFAATTTTVGDSLGWTFTWGSDTLCWGLNYLSVVPLDLQAFNNNNLGSGTPNAGERLVVPVWRTDSIPPAIAWWDSLADDNDPTDGYGPYTVRAVITDFSGIDHAKLYYRLNAGKDWPCVAMNRADGDTFVAALPAQTLAEGDTADMAYEISAGDHAHNVNIVSSSTRSFNLRNLTGVAGSPTEPALPKTYALQAAYPNPSGGKATIKYQLPKQSAVRLLVYNIAGQLVKSFDEGQKPAGYHQISWNENQLSNGIYFYQLKAGDFTDTKKLVVLK